MKTAEKVHSSTSSVVQAQTASTFFKSSQHEETHESDMSNHAFFQPVIQAKLKVSQPDDPLEKEADKVADDLVSNADSPITNISTVREEELQRRVLPSFKSTFFKQPAVTNRHVQHVLSNTAGRAPQPAAVDVAQPITQHTLAQPILEKPARTAQDALSDSLTPIGSTLQQHKQRGEALPDGLKRKFEKRLGKDLSKVRLHLDSTAVQITAKLGAQALAHGSDIYFNNGAYNPHTKEGQQLIAHELVHTIQQGAIREAKRSSTHDQFDTTNPSAVTSNRDVVIPKREVASNDKRKVSNAAVENKNKDKGAKDKATDAKAATAAKPKKKSPKTPKQDKAFQTVKSSAEVTSVNQQQHEDTAVKVAQIEASGQLPKQTQQMANAQDAKLDLMEQQEQGQFDADAFTEKILEQVSAAIPQTEDEAKEFKKKNKLGKVKENLSNEVAAEKAQASGAIATAAEANLNPSEQPGVDPQNLEEPLPGDKPVVANSEKAAPKPFTDDEISLEEDVNALDEEMANADVTEVQLAESNEPTFLEALDSKTSAQQSALEGPSEYRQQEKVVLKKAEKASAEAVDNEMGAMHLIRSGLFSNVFNEQDTTKNKKISRKTEIINELNRLYNDTKTKVDTNLNDLETRTLSSFDQVTQDANRTFENNVSRRLDAHYGWFTWDDAVVEFFAGLPDEVQQIFDEEKALFVQTLNTEIRAIANDVAKTLNDTMQIIDEGNKKKEDFWNSLSEDEQSMAEEAKNDIDAQFGSLKQQVNQKQEALVKGLADRYVQNVNGLQERFDSIKASKQGFLGAALQAIGGVIKTILAMKDMLLSVLARVASLIMDIISSPIKFLGNLVNAIGTGINQFATNIWDHLQKGFMEWLVGNLPPGIALPEVWDLKGVLGFVAQILGLSWANIRERAVKKLGEKVVAVMETGFEIFNILMTQGLPGLWQYVLEQIGNLQEMAMNAIKTMLIENVIKAGIKWILGLLNPAGAFIKACMLIYDIIMFFVNNGSRILSLVNAIIDSTALILRGSIAQAAEKVEQSLARIIPIAIGFLASLLGLGNLNDKVKDIIESLRRPINRVIDWVLDKAIAFSKKIGLDKVANKIDEKIEQGKEWAADKVEKGKAAIGSIYQWLINKVSVKLLNGEQHSLNVEMMGNQPKLIMRSTPENYEAFIIKNFNLVEAPLTPHQQKQKEAALQLARDITAKLALYNQLAQEDKVQWGKDVSEKIKQLARLTAKLPFPKAIDKAPATIVTYGGTTTEGFGKIMQAKYLSKNFIKGEPARDEQTSVLGWDLARSFQKISQKGKPYPMYVKGHLLNHKLGGPANVLNLTPITQTTNHRHHDEVEAGIKDAILKSSTAVGGVVNYTVKVDYSKHPSRKALKQPYIDTYKENLKLLKQLESVGATQVDRDEVSKLAQEALDIVTLLTYEENQVPSAFVCQWETLQFDTDKNDWVLVPSQSQQRRIPNVINDAVEHYKPVFDPKKLLYNVNIKVDD